MAANAVRFTVTKRVNSSGAGRVATPQLGGPSPDGDRRARRIVQQPEAVRQQHEAGVVVEAAPGAAFEMVHAAGRQAHPTGVVGQIEGRTQFIPR
jgi:hypothetical protein